MGGPTAATTTNRTDNEAILPQYRSVDNSTMRRVPTPPIVADDCGKKPFVSASQAPPSPSTASSAPPSPSYDVLWNVPNMLTIARIVLIPLFLLIAYTPLSAFVAFVGGDVTSAAADGKEEERLALAKATKHNLLTTIFVVASVTDWFDGYLARVLNQMTAFGRFLDPVADKLMVASALIVLIQLYHNDSDDRGVLAATAAAAAANDGVRTYFSRAALSLTTIVMITREIAVSALREWMAGIPNGEGSAKVEVSALGKWKAACQMVGITLYLLDWRSLDLLGTAFLSGAVVTSLWSMWLYFKAAWPYLLTPQA